MNDSQLIAGAGKAKNKRSLASRLSWHFCSMGLELPAGRIRSRRSESQNLDAYNAWANGRRARLYDLSDCQLSRMELTNRLCRVAAQSMSLGASPLPFSLASREGEADAVLPSRQRIPPPARCLQWPGRLVSNMSVAECGSSVGAIGE
jgi:hypothetical protein